MGTVTSANVELVEAGAPGKIQRSRQPAVDRAMDLFELVARSRTGLTLSELSRKLNLPKSTAHYLIYTLETRGYLQRTADGRHTLGLRFARLAAASTAEHDFGRSSKTYLKPHA